MIISLITMTCKDQVNINPWSYLQRNRYKHIQSTKNEIKYILLRWRREDQLRERESCNRRRSYPWRKRLFRDFLWGETIVVVVHDWCNSVVLLVWLRLIRFWESGEELDWRERTETEERGWGKSEWRREWNRTT